MHPGLWHYHQLEHELKNRPPHETDRIELINPGTVKALDQILYNDFWLPVKETVDDSDFSIMDGFLTEDGRPSIDNKWDRLPCRCFELKLDNRENPLHPQNFLRNWIARIEMECSIDHYYMQLVYHLYLPADYEFSNIQFLMSYPDFQPLPPELTYFAGGPISEDSFDLKFTFGSGGNRALQMIEVVPEKVREKIMSLLELLEISEAFAADMYDDEGLPDFLNGLIRVHELWAE